MTTFARRRLMLGLGTLALSAAWIAVYLVRGVTLRDTHFLSGFALLGLMLALTFFNIRKKLPFLPLLSASQWLQFHIYAGWLCAVVFLTHLDFSAPSGKMNALLAVVFSVVVLSGILGVFLSRTMARRITSRGNEALMDRIPIYRRQIQERVEGLMFNSVEKSKSVTLPEFYNRFLFDFLSRPRFFLRHVFESNLPKRRILLEFSSVERYLNESEKKVLDEARELTLIKNDLDYHHALQRTLKLWLFVHIPLTYGLLVLSFVHIWVVFPFAGGLK